jgi:hypothetical protein
MRSIDIHNPGSQKRSLVICDDPAICIYNLTRRCHDLIETVPAENKSKGLSYPSLPDWLDEQMGSRVELERENEEIGLARYQGLD